MLRYAEPVGSASVLLRKRFRSACSSSPSAVVNGFPVSRISHRRSQSCTSLPSGVSFLHSHLGKVGKGLATLEFGILDDSCISIAREVAGPFDECAAFVITTSDGVATECRHGAGVGECWLRCDDTVCDVVVERLAGC